MRRISLMLVPILVLIGASAQAHHRTSFRSSGSCVEYATGVTVDASRAQALVPEGFHVLDVGGQSLVAVFAEDCSTSVDDSPEVPSIVSGVLVLLDPISSPAGCQAYDFSWGTNSADGWHAAMNDLGFRADLIEDSTVTFDGLRVEANIPSDDAPWRTEAAAASESPLRAPVTTVHCHVGPRGLVRGTYDHDISAMAGAGPLVLGDGPLWRALGVTSQTTAPGVVFRFTWTGTTELVP